MPLPRAPCQIAMRTIQQAFDDLGLAICPADARGFGTSTLEDVRQEALAIETQLGARGALKNMRRLQPLFAGLEHYAKVVDVLCNGTPFLPWIWAPITLILRVGSEYIEAFEKIMQVYIQMAEPLRRFETLGHTFGNNKEFQQTLAIFYADILEFHKHAYVLVNRSGWKLLCRTSWGRFQRQFDGIIADMTRHEALVDKEANAYNIAEARKMRNELRSWREETRQSQVNTAQQESTKQLWAIRSWLCFDESDQLAIINPLWSEGEKYPGTCSWLSKDEGIRLFLEHQPSKALLWLQGIPGSGKTVLFSQLIRFMSAADMPTIHYFCSHSFASSLAYDDILRSLVLKLAQRNPDLVSYVYANTVVTEKAPTRAALQKLAIELVSILSQVTSKDEYLWILVDGIDECAEDHQQALFRLLRQMMRAAKASGAIIKVLISSRQTSMLATMLKKSHVVSLTARKSQVDEAIRQYATQRLLAVRARLDSIGVTNAARNTIEACIVKKSDGMFLYAKLVTDYLSNNIFFTAEEIMDSVMALPKELSDFYRKILTQILAHLDKRSISRLRSLCGWIAFVKRPLAKHELLSALSFQCEEPYFTGLAPEYILEICSPLIEQRPNNTFSFIHVSLQEYGQFPNADDPFTILCHLSCLAYKIAHFPFMSSTVPPYTDHHARFLQSPSSSLSISAFDALREHTRAVVGCLIYGMKHLCGHEDHDKSLRIIKGFHALHIYAYEHWADLLLEYFVRESAERFDVHLIEAACGLAGCLEGSSDPAIPEPRMDPRLAHDPRLHHLDKWPTLQRHVARYLCRRPSSRLQSESLKLIHNESEMDQEGSRGQDNIQATLVAYQTTIRTLLDRQYFPGVSGEQFEAFKAQYRTTAFTCRYSYCPYASRGFDSLDKCRQHEDTHTIHLDCEVPGCQYPSFPSQRALRRHMNNQHRPTEPRRRIRRSQGLSSMNHNGLRTNVATPVSEMSPARSATQEFQKIDSQFSASDEEPSSLMWYAPNYPHDLQSNSRPPAPSNSLAATEPLYGSSEKRINFQFSKSESTGSFTTPWTRFHATERTPEEHDNPQAGPVLASVNELIADYSNSHIAYTASSPHDNQGTPPSAHPTFPQSYPNYIARHVHNKENDPSPQFQHPHESHGQAEPSVFEETPAPTNGERPPLFSPFANSIDGLNYLFGKDVQGLRLMGNEALQCLATFEKEERVKLARMLQLEIRASVSFELQNDGIDILLYYFMMMGSAGKRAASTALQSDSMQLTSSQEDIASTDRLLEIAMRGQSSDDDETVAPING